MPTFSAKENYSLHYPIGAYENPCQSTFVIKRDLEKQHLPASITSQEEDRTVKSNRASSRPAQRPSSPTKGDQDVEYASKAETTPCASESPANEFKCTEYPTASERTDNAMIKHSHERWNSPARLSNKGNSAFQTLKLTGNEIIKDCPSKATFKETPDSSSSCYSAIQVRTPEDPQYEIQSTSSPASEISGLTVTGDLNVLAQDFVGDLVERLVQRCVDLYHGEFRSCTESHSEPSSSTSQQNIGETPATSQSGSLKRRRQSDKEDGDDYRDGKEDTGPTKRQSRSVSNNVRLWACPYTKFDPIRYSEHNQQDEKAYRKCASATLTDISCVKQHLRRTHREPSYFCGKCYEAFRVKKDLLQHNQVNCQSGTPKYQEMMTEEQYLLIPKYLTNTVPSWYTIFNILFEDATQPTSPYVSICDAATIQQFVDLFRLTGPEEFLELLRTRLERDPQSLHLNTSLRALIEETFEVAFPEYLQRLRTVVNDSLIEYNHVAASQTEQSTTDHTLGISSVPPESQHSLPDFLDTSGNSEAQAWILTLESCIRAFGRSKPICMANLTLMAIYSCQTILFFALMTKFWVLGIHSAFT